MDQTNSSIDVKPAEFSGTKNQSDSSRHEKTNDSGWEYRFFVKTNHSEGWSPWFHIHETDKATVEAQVHAIKCKLAESDEYQIRHIPAFQESQPEPPAASIQTNEENAACQFDQYIAMVSALSHTLKHWTSLDTPAKS